MKFFTVAERSSNFTILAIYTILKSRSDFLLFCHFRTLIKHIIIPKVLPVASIQLEQDALLFFTTAALEERKKASQSRVKAHKELELRLKARRNKKECPARVRDSLNAGTLIFAREKFSQWLLFARWQGSFVKIHEAETPTATEKSE